MTWCMQLIIVATYFKFIINNYNSLFNNFDVCVKDFTSLLMSCTCVNLVNNSGRFN